MPVVSGCKNNKIKETREDATMKKQILLTALASLTMGACSSYYTTSSYNHDDVYYSNAPVRKVFSEEITAVPSGNRVTQTQTSKTRVSESLTDYEKYRQSLENGQNEGWTSSDQTGKSSQYSSEEQAIVSAEDYYQDSRNSYIVNNYYYLDDPYYWDWGFSSRIYRFARPYYWAGYYNPFYWGYYGGFAYDPFYWGGNWGLSIGFGWGWGSRFGWGWGHPYYGYSPYWGGYWGSSWGGHWGNYWGWPGNSHYTVRGDYRPATRRSSPLYSGLSGRTSVVNAYGAGGSSVLRTSSSTETSAVSRRTPSGSPSTESTVYTRPGVSQRVPESAGSRVSTQQRTETSAGTRISTEQRTGQSPSSLQRTGTESRSGSTYTPVYTQPRTGTNGTSGTRVQSGTSSSSRTPASTPSYRSRTVSPSSPSSGRTNSGSVGSSSSIRSSSPSSGGFSSGGGSSSGGRSSGGARR